MSRLRGKVLKPQYPKSFEEYKMFVCPIDRKDEDHKHKHRASDMFNNRFFHMELFDYCAVTVSFEVVPSINKKEMHTGIIAIHIGALGTFYNEDSKPSYLKRRKDMGEILSGMLKGAYRVKQIE